MAKRTARKSGDATPGMKSLDRMVGTWKVSGGARGTVRYEWFDRKSALIQYVNLGDTRGFEVIRFDQDSQSWRSWFFDRSGSTVLEYTYEVDAEQLKISIDMEDRRGSFIARFSDGGNVLEGRWDWTHSGKKMGYNATLTRVRKVRARRNE
jgi:hypothetical protein